VCWSAKGGSGTTVVAASLALTRPRPVVLVDLAGELPAVLGLPEPAGPGAAGWFDADAGPARLHDLLVDVVDGVRLLPRGGTAPSWRDDRWRLLVDELSKGAALVVDAGTGEPEPAVRSSADRALLVTRACFLSLRRAVAMTCRPDGVVLLEEVGRALRRVDVERALGAPVVATLPVDPVIARAVDAGLLTARLPRVIERDLQDAA
jgi:MinD superfamily P-loop ATPase